MNASSFITFFTYMLQHNGKRFYKGLYVTFKLAPDLKNNSRPKGSGFEPHRRHCVAVLEQDTFILA